MGADSNLRRQRIWTDLPMEILSFIATRLRLLELLSFRGTCKDFRSASTTATAKIESSKNPWLLFHKPGDSKCLIYNEDGSKTYNRHIPDLADAVCLASYQGWLLLHKHESIFFFSPFSLSKIPLPHFPQKQTDGLLGHVATFSEPPTSPNCIVSIINPVENSYFEINMISKGQDKWTQYKITPYTITNVSGAIFDHKSKMFYYMYGENKVLTFSVTDKKWKPYKIVSRGKFKDDTEDLPYIYFENMFDNFKKTHELLKLEEDEYVDVCGLTFEPENSYCPRMYLNEAIDVSPTKTRMCKAVWIQPRFYEAQKDLHW